MSPTTTATIVELQEVHLSPDSPRAVEVTPPSSPLPPRPGRVFEATQAGVISHKSRLLIICLIVAANLAQFIINFVTFSSGFSLNKALGRDASPATANWMAAAYSSVNPRTFNSFHCVVNLYIVQPHAEWLCPDQRPAGCGLRPPEAAYHWWFHHGALLPPQWLLH